MILGSELAWVYFVVPMLSKENYRPSFNIHEATVSQFGKFWFSPEVQSESLINNIALATQPAIIALWRTYDNDKSSSGKETSGNLKVCGGLMVCEDRKYAMKELEEDPLHCLKQDEKMTMSVEDEHVFNHYFTTVQEV